MKKNRMMRLASVLLVCVLLTTSVISGTFAKYTTKYTAEDTARVALFKVTAFGTTADATTETVTVDIFDQSKIYDTKDANYNAGVDDEDIKNSTNGTAIIAPGSWGTFSFDVKNESEVDVTYTVDYTVDEKNVPLEWSTDGSTWTDSLSNVSATELAMETGTATVTIYWRWAFTNTSDEAARDGSDTALGFAGTAAPSVKIEVTITQVD